MPFWIRYQSESASDEFRLLFAGHFDKRKGMEMLMDALERLDHLPWRIEIAGPVSASVAERSERFFANPRVKYLGLLSRRDLASAMARADVFVFPSLSEGSARVVFRRWRAAATLLRRLTVDPLLRMGFTAPLSRQATAWRWLMPSRMHIGIVTRFPKLEKITRNA